MDRILRARLVRFVLVGGGAAALLMALTFALIRAGVPPFAGGLCAYALTFVVAYALQRNWTFEGAGRHGRTLPRYFLLQAGCALASASLSHLLVAVLRWPPAQASAAMTVCVSAVSYVVSTVWVFADDKRPS